MPSGEACRYRMLEHNAPKNDCYQIISLLCGWLPYHAIATNQSNPSIIVADILFNKYAADAMPKAKYLPWYRPSKYCFSSYLREEIGSRHFGLRNATRLHFSDDLMQSFTQFRLRFKAGDHTKWPWRSSESDDLEDDLWAYWIPTWECYILYVGNTTCVVFHM